MALAHGTRRTCSSYMLDALVTLQSSYQNLEPGIIRPNNNAYCLCCCTTPSHLHIRATFCSLLLCLSSPSQVDTDTHRTRRPSATSIHTHSPASDIIYTSHMYIKCLVTHPYHTEQKAGEKYLYDGKQHQTKTSFFLSYGEQNNPLVMAGRAAAAVMPYRPDR